MEEKASWLRELCWLVLPSKRSTTTPLAMVMILDLLNHCLHSIKRVELMHSFKVRQKMNVKDAAQEAGSIAGFNEKTVRQYQADFYKNGGKKMGEIQEVLAFK